MDTKALEEKIKYLEKIIELQEKLLGQKATPIFYPVQPIPIQPYPYDPWKPWQPYYYETQPNVVCTTTYNGTKWVDAHAFVVQ